MDSTLAALKSCSHLHPFDADQFDVEDFPGAQRRPRLVLRSQLLSIIQTPDQKCPREEYFIGFTMDLSLISAPVCTTIYQIDKQ